MNVYDLNRCSYFKYSGEIKGNLQTGQVKYNDWIYFIVISVLFMPDPNENDTDFINTLEKQRYYVGE